MPQDKSYDIMFVRYAKKHKPEQDRVKAFTSTYNIFIQEYRVLK